MSEDAGIEPRTVATTALTVRRSNHSARSHSLLGYIIINNNIIILMIYCHTDLSFDTRSTGYGMKKGYSSLIIGWKDRDRKILKCAASSLT